jgi:hypothetical protein
METVLITGGTGMIGRALTQALIERGYQVIIITRSPGAKFHEKKGNISYARWDVERGFIDKEAISCAEYIIHLAGANFAARRWTSKRKTEILSSRVDGAKLIIDSLKTMPNRVRCVISASGISWYGQDDKNVSGPFTENDPAADDFMAQTCKQWEAAIEPASFLGKRLVKLRIGPVLSTEGGAFVEFRNPLKFGLATIIGDGKQIVSWIHIDDLVRIILFAMENEKMDGVYNAVAPEPVSNEDLILTMAEKIRGKTFIPFHTPSFVLKIVFGEMINEILRSITVSSEKLQHTGFIFQYPDIESAVQHLTNQ